MQEEYYSSEGECKRKTLLKNSKKKKKILEQKYPKLLIEDSILRAQEIPLEVLRQPKTAKNEIVPFSITYHPNVFPIIRKSFDNLQYFKTISNIFQRKKLVKSMSEAPNLLKASLYQYKRANKTFLLKAVQAVI